MRANSLERSWPWLAFGALLLLAWLAYRPGLSGGFLFDDWINLDALGRHGPVDNAAALLRYLSSGTADPLGRPLSLLSFLLDARDWPADPAPFLRTNLLLHLVNGALLFALLRRLERLRDPRPRHADAVALVGAGAWLLHPLLVSTTLYAVQREAMLPATCVLGGLLCYVTGLSRYLRSQGARGGAWMVTGIVAGTALAALAKANGVLLPLLAWALTATVLQPARIAPLAPAPARRLAWLQRGLLVLPGVLLLLYVAHFLPQWNQTPPGRDWTIGQRLLTQPRVLLDYLQLLLVPRSVSSGLYNDDYAVSTGLLHPLATLPALLAVLALAASALRWRARWPRYAAAVLFFLGAHLLESSAVPLEPYFEHRNYLPALLLFWPPAATLVHWRQPAWLRGAIAAGVLALLALTTWQRSSLWGRPDTLAALWATQNPDSARAQATWAISRQRAGRPTEALARLRPLWRAHPGDLQIALSAVDAACQAGPLPPADAAALAHTLRIAPQGHDLMRQWLADRLLSDDRCIGTAQLAQWLDAAAANPGFNPPRGGDRNLAPLRGALALRRRQPELALHWFDRAYLATRRPQDAAGQAALLAAHGAYAQALAHLDLYERTRAQPAPVAPGMPWLHARVLACQDYWPRRIATLRTQIAAAQRQAAHRPQGSPQR